jgi:Spx/MgsR family transcriptional regulator
MIIYGIKNCDTMKKAFTWLNNKGIEYTFFDYKKEILAEEQFKFWLTKLPLEQIVNKQGTTFKKLTDEQKVAVLTPETAFSIINKNTSVIKRPLIEINNQVYVGFNEATWAEIFK